MILLDFGTVNVRICLPCGDGSCNERVPANRERHPWCPLTIHIPVQAGCGAKRSPGSLGAGRASIRGSARSSLRTRLVEWRLAQNEPTGRATETNTAQHSRCAPVQNEPTGRATKIN